MSYAKQRYHATLEYLDCEKLASFWLDQNELEVAETFLQRMHELELLFNL